MKQNHEFQNLLPPTTVPNQAIRNNVQFRKHVKTYLDCLLTPETDNGLFYIPSRTRPLDRFSSLWVKTRDGNEY